MLILKKTRLLQTREKARTYARKKRAAGFKTLVRSKPLEGYSKGKWLVGVYEVHR
jgi:hypothetical protein